MAAMLFCCCHDSVCKIVHDSIFSASNSCNASIQIWNISEDGMSLIKNYGCHFNLFLIFFFLLMMVTNHLTKYYFVIIVYNYVHNIIILLYYYLTNEWVSISHWRMTLQWVAYIMNNWQIWRPFCFFVAMTTEENIEHMYDNTAIV